MKRHLFNRSKDIRRTILVADDEEINRQILKYNLGRFYDVIEAADGQEALEQIRQNKGELSLLMLDLNMPRMTGYEVLEALQESEELQRLPVIVLTSEKEAEIESLQLGAVDFLEKGRDMEELRPMRVVAHVDPEELTGFVRSHKGYFKLSENAEVKPAKVKREKKDSEGKVVEAGEKSFKYAQPVYLYFDIPTGRFEVNADASGIDMEARMARVRLPFLSTTTLSPLMSTATAR